MARLEGKVALVTGAGSGIGKGSAIMFAQQGAKVVIVDIDEKAGEDTLLKIKENGGDAVFAKTNVRVKDDIKAAIKKTIDTYGKIDILMNAAGVLVHKPFMEHTDDDYTLLSEINLRAYIWFMQEAIPLMAVEGNKIKGRAKIINVASISFTKPETNAYFYGMFKAAINRLTSNIVREWSDRGINFNVIAPGPISTNMTPKHVKENTDIQAAMIKEIAPVGRLGEPEDIAFCATYLASDEADLVTGATFVIDGGACCMG